MSLRGRAASEVQLLLLRFDGVLARVARWFLFRPKIQFWYTVEDLGMDNVVIYSGLLEYFTIIWYIYWAFGNSVAIWYIFTRFGTLYQVKSGNP
jgi:hypothetical protein